MKITLPPTSPRLSAFASSDENSESNMCCTSWRKPSTPAAVFRVTNRTGWSDKPQNKASTRTESDGLITGILGLRGKMIIRALYQWMLSDPISSHTVFCNNKNMILDTWLAITQTLFWTIWDWTTNPLYCSNHPWFLNFLPKIAKQNFKHGQWPICLAGWLSPRTGLAYTSQDREGVFSCITIAGPALLSKQQLSYYIGKAFQWHIPETYHCLLFLSFHSKDMKLTWMAPLQTVVDQHQPWMTVVSRRCWPIIA